MRQPKPFFRKQTSSWYVQFDGRQINLGKDEKAAWAEYHRLMSDRRQTVAATHSLTAVHLLDAYYRWCVQHRAASTAKRMKSRLKSVCEFLGSKLLATKVKPHHIESWLMDRYPGANPTYRNTLIGSVKGAFAWATRMGHLDVDPIASMPKPTPLIREEFVPYEDWPRLLAAASPDLRDMLEFCLQTGARAEEVFKIEARHIENGKISLERQLAKGRKKRRQIWLSEKAKEIVARLLTKHTEGHIFRSGKGNPWDSCSTNCAMRRLSAKFGRPVCLTMMRHSFAHHRLTSGQDLATVAALMGHCDGRMLTSRYGHLTANDDYMSRAASLA